MAEAAGILLLDAEDNSLSGLTVTEEGSNVISINGTSAAHGTLGYNFAFSGNSGENLCYFYKSFTTGSDIYGRCYFYIPSSFSCNNSTFTICGLFRDTNYYAVMPRFSFSGTTLSFDRLYYYINSGTAYIDISGTITRDVWHYIELRYKSGNGDGLVSIYYDGTLKTSVSNLTNNSYTAQYIFVGNTAYGAGVPTAGSQIYVDDIKIKSSYIGAYSDLSYGGGSLIGLSSLVGGGVLCGNGNLIN